MTRDLEYECKRIWKSTKFDKDGHRYSVECVRWFPTDNGIFVSGGFDKTIKIWDTSCLECVETLKFDGKIYNFDLSPSKTRNCTVAGKYLPISPQIERILKLTRFLFQLAAIKVQSQFLNYTLVPIFIL